ncbi:MAG: AAA family ATPase [Actinomycetota bacterium]|nr:AAA family ATPase [Actinomycetota bacterium]
MVRQRAREVVAELEARKHPQPPPDMGTLADLLARPEADEWRVEGLVPANGRLLLSAQRKTGKTTFVGNLARALLTGEPLLGRFPTDKLTGRVVVLNYEVSGRTFGRWMDDIGVPASGLFVVNLRGRRNLLADEAGRQELVEIVRAAEGEVLMVDPFGRAFTGKSQNDAAEVTPWLVRLDEVAEDAGVREVLLTAHAGWNGERTRGSSALEDWPDVLAWMTRDEETDDRFFRAEGRDVEVEEDQLHFRRETRTLSLSGAGSRKQVRDVGRVDELAQLAARIVRDKPGINVSGLREALRAQGGHLQREDAGAAARRAVEQGLVRTEPGPRNSVLHFPSESAGSAVEASRPDPSRPVPGTGVSRPDPSYRSGTAHGPPQGRAVPSVAKAS